MNHQALRRRVRVAQVLLIAIVVAGSVYVADTVVGGGMFRDPYRVTMNLAEAGGLHERSTVNYRGQRIGTVTDVRLSRDGVVAELAIDEGVRVPRDSEFLVSNLSAVGEQYVDIRPRTDSGPWLEDGSTVAEEETRTPVPVHQVVGDTQRLLERVDVRGSSRPSPARRTSRSATGRRTSGGLPSSSSAASPSCASSSPTCSPSSNAARPRCAPAWTRRASSGGSPATWR